MKLLLKITCVLITLLYSTNITAQTIDSDGWTKLNPINTNKIIYVSSTDGNDTTAETYTPNSSSIGIDPFLPSGSIKAFKTIDAALKNVSDEEAAWVLLKRGDTFTETLLAKSGTSVDTPFVYSSYGTKKELPLIQLDKKIAFSSLAKLHNFYIIGIDFYAFTSDPKSAEFKSYKDNKPCLFIYAGVKGNVSNILIEGCVFRFWEGINFSSKEDEGITNIKLRRNTILDSYASDSHSSGLFTNKVNDITLEENVFDHNGWYQQSILGDNNQSGGQATIFNHNLYFSSVKKTRFSGNSFYRPSSIGAKFTANTGIASSTDITITNNFFYDCEIGISVGGNNRTGPYRFKNMTIDNNVFNSLGTSKPTNRTLGWAIEIDDWDNGICEDNFFVHQNVKNLAHYGIGLYLRGENKDVTIQRNTFYNLKSTNYIFLDKSEFKNSFFRSNTIHNTSSNSKHVFVNKTFPENDLLFSNNTYSGQGNTPALYIQRDLQSITDWKSKTTEDITNTTIPNYLDPDRSLERYINEVLGLESLREFYKNLRKQHILNWNEDYTAYAINTWIKEGFEIQSGTPIAVTGISFNEDQKNKAITKNQDLTLYPIIQPTNASNKKVSWISSDPTIATVDDNGKLNFLTTGNVTVTCITEDGTFTAESNLIITPEEDTTIDVTGIIIVEEQKFVTVEEKKEVVLIPPIVKPFNANNKKYDWTSSNENIATIDSNGRIKAISIGEVSINATTEDGGFTASITLVVTPEVADTSHQEFVYKQTNGEDVLLRVYYPASWKATDKRKAIVMFHGGSWVSGSYFQMFSWCNYLASQGMVAISAQYTYGSVESCVLDARSAMRWVRSNSNSLGIDANEISAAGASAGAHIAMSTFLSEGLDDVNDNLNISPKPNAFFLIDPALKIPTNDYQEIKTKWGEAIANLTNPIVNFSFDTDFPPTICFSGTNDGRISEAHQMVQYLHYKGISSSLWTASKQVHGFADKVEWFSSIINRVHNFLNKQDILPNKYPLEIINPKLRLHDFSGNQTNLFSPVSILNFPSERDTSIANNLINNSGLNGTSITPGTAHSEDANTMWFTERGFTSGEIIFDMGAPKDIEKVHLWNWNSPSQSLKTGVRTIEIFTASSDSQADLTYRKTIEIFPGGHFAQNFNLAENNVRLVKFKIITPFNSAFQSMGLAEVKFSGKQPTLNTSKFESYISATNILQYNTGNGTFQVTSDYRETIKFVDVIGLSGSKINTITLINGLGSIEDLSSGIYFLKFKNKNQIAIAVEKYLKL